MLRHFHFTLSQKLVKWYNNKPEIGKFNQNMFFLQSFSFFFYRRQRIKCPWDTIILIGVTRIHSRESHHVNFIWAIHQPRGSYINWLFFFLQVMTPQISMLCQTLQLLSLWSFLSVVCYLKETTRSAKNLEHLELGWLLNLAWNSTIQEILSFTERGQ